MFEETGQMVAVTGIISAESGGELILMNVEQGRCYAMNEMGTYIWRSLEKPLPVPQLVADISAEFSSDPSFSKDHVLSFLARLRDNGLIKVLAA